MARGKLACRAAMQLVQEIASGYLKRDSHHPYGQGPLWSRRPAGTWALAQVKGKVLGMSNM